MNILFTTRTNWHEAPRIRHQLAQLLISMGHKVIFVERPVPFWKKKSKPQSELPNLYKVQVHELIHPQLRIFRWLSRIDQIYRRKQLLRLLSLHGIDLHFSFFLDAHCLLPDIPRIQIINDDFVGAATWISKKTTKIDFQLSVRSAHKTLTVSYPLNEKVARAGGDPRLFLPWASRSIPNSLDFTKKHRILYFGYLANRIRWNIIEHFVSNNIQVDFYAPLSSAKANDLKWLERLGRYPAFNLNKETRLEDLNPSNYVCSIQPYVVDNHYNQMITFSNRTARLLSLGIPSLHQELPYLVACNKGVIFRANTPDEYMSGFHYLRANAADSARLISTFLSEHDVNARKVQLQTVLDSVAVKKP